MNKKFVYQRNASSKEGCYSYKGTVDQGNRLGIGMHRKIDVKKRKVYVSKYL